MINEKGNRIPVFVTRNFVDGEPIIKFTFDGKTKTTVDRSAYKWPGGRDKPPLDEPKCGFDGKKCEGEYAEIL